MWGARKLKTMQEFTQNESLLWLDVDRVQSGYEPQVGFSWNRVGSRDGVTSILTVLFHGFFVCLPGLVDAGSHPVDLLLRDELSLPGDASVAVLLLLEGKSCTKLKSRGRKDGFRVKNINQQKL